MNLKSLPKDLQKKLVHLPGVDIYIAEVDPKTLSDNPKNWRIHPRRQRDTYKAFKSKHGWLGFIIYNIRTSRLLDGHMRVDEAIKNSEPSVPVIFKDISEEEENEILANLDNIGLLAKRNNEALKSLTEANSKYLKEIKDKNTQKLSQLNKDLRDLTESPETILLKQSTSKIRINEPLSSRKDQGKPSRSNSKSNSDSKSRSNRDSDKDSDIEDSEDSESYFPPDHQDEIVQEFINDDVLFPGITDLGIPELLPDRLCDSSLCPIRTYAKDFYSTDAYYCISSGPFESGQPIGTIGFYTEDYRFEDAFTNASVFSEFLKELDPVAVLSPDYSTYSDWPLAIRLWSLYRSRWCSRFWQELHFNLIPSIQSLGDEELTSNYVLETLPPQCPILSIQCRKSEVEGLIDFIKLCVDHRRPEKFLLYGGEEKQKYLHGHLPYTTGKKKVQYIYLPQYTEKRRKLRSRS